MILGWEWVSTEGLIVIIRQIQTTLPNIVSCLNDAGVIMSEISSKSWKEGHTKFSTLCAELILHMRAR